jgi:hypothetical protein
VVPCGDGTKNKDCGESLDLLSPECEPEPRLDEPDEGAPFTPLNNFFILHNTCNNNTQQEVPNTLAFTLVLAEQVEGNKRLCREIASDEASKKI